MSNPNIPVKFYHSGMQNVPQLSTNWGDLTTLLDALLCDGFNQKTVDSLVYANGVVTATINAGHQYLVPQVLLIQGASDDAFNGEARINWVSSTQFTYPVTGVPAGPATGAITVKVAPLNFDRPFGTATLNKRVYRSKNPLSNKPYLRVDNSLDPNYTTTFAKKGKVLMAENMSDVDTIVGAQAPWNPAAPTQGIVSSGTGVNCIDGWYKWYYARSDGNSTDNSAYNAGNRSWVLVGDDRGFYLFTENNPGSNGRVGYCFTDFASFRQGDGYNTLLAANDWYAAASASWNNNSVDVGTNFAKTLDFTGKVLMRDHLQVGGNIRAGFMALNTNNAAQVTGYTTGIPWPNAVDYGLILHPIYLRHEAPANIRGKLPGMFWVHNDGALGDLQTITGVSGYAGRTFLIVGMATGLVGNVARYAFDISGPWW